MIIFGAAILIFIIAGAVVMGVREDEKRKKEKERKK
jgi:glucose uptake protein GlcU